MKTLYLDIETTDAAEPYQPHQIAYVGLDSKGEQILRNRNIRIGAEGTPPGSVFLTKQVAQATILRDLKRFYKAKPSGPFYLAAWNVKHDALVLGEFMQNYKDFKWQHFFRWPTIEVATLAAYQLEPVRSLMPNFKLATVAAALGLDVDPKKLHDASYDVALLVDIAEHVEPNPMWDGMKFRQKVIERMKNHAN